jgi:hypothetical protein
MFFIDVYSNFKAYEKLKSVSKILILCGQFGYQGMSMSVLANKISARVLNGTGSFNNGFLSSV